MRLVDRLEETTTVLGPNDEATVLIAPAGTSLEELLDPAGPAVLLHPSCPDEPPPALRP